MIIEEQKKIFEIVKFLRDNLYAISKKSEKIYFKYSNGKLNLYFDSESPFYLLCGELDIDNELLEFFQQHSGKTVSLTDQDLLLLKNLKKTSCIKLDLDCGILFTDEGNVEFKIDTFKNESKVIDIKSKLINHMEYSSNDESLKIYKPDGKKLLEVLKVKVYSIVSDSFMVNFSDDLEYVSISDRFVQCKTKAGVKEYIDMNLSLEQIFRTVN